MEPALIPNCDTRHLLYGGQRVTPDASSYNNVTPVSLTLRTTGHQQYPRGAHSPPTNRPKHYRKGARFIHTPKKCSVTHARRRFIDTSSLRLNRSTKVGRDLHTIRHTEIEILSQNAFRTVENGTGQGFRKSQPAGQSQPVDRVAGESPVSVTSGDGGIPAAGDGGPAVATFSGGGACTSRARRGETSGGACGFVRAPIEAWLVSTASSRREEHDGGLECTR
ncbi:hypothetical protein YC2023_008487 [Brassica napus]